MFEETSAYLNILYFYFLDTKNLFILHDILFIPVKLLSATLKAGSQMWINLEWLSTLLWAAKSKWQRHKHARLAAQSVKNLDERASSWKICLTNEFWVFGTCVSYYYWGHSLGICIIFLNPILNVKSEDPGSDDIIWPENFCVIELS